MTRKRDDQRSKVYAAERVAFSEPTEETAEFETMQQVSDYVDTVKGTAWWVTCKGYNQIRLHSGAGNRTATYNPRTRKIKLPKWSRHKWVICHELAHALTHKTHGLNVPAHGGVFCLHFIQLVTEAIDPDTGSRLADSFSTAGLRVMSLDDFKPRR